FRPRPDGYHELESILQQISLSDFLTFIPKRTPGWQFTCTDPQLCGKDNLVCRAARELAGTTGKEMPGVTITLFKNIPTGSGLGGGSSDAATTLKGLNSFWKLGLSFQELSRLGAFLGSDVPFFLQGGTALARGRGEKITALPHLPFMWAVLALPPRLTISTASVYGSLGDSVPSPRTLGPLQEAICRSDRKGVLEWLYSGQANSLQPLVLARYPRLRLLKKRMSELGLKPVMSGSGPALFALSGSYPLSRGAALTLQAEGYRVALCWTIQETNQHCS
ncbi:MAG TPA: 4-(cytidine 5'-diphospho)-2-C-methyl-D-erythritol kinase, partial [Firmicutes bacterium]|nr:4-(cytidine 5'-diphospho)-2-C-methyl-D-erythritol kinase [Bacillota bacterium]